MLEACLIRSSTASVRARSAAHERLAVESDGRARSVRAPCPARRPGFAAAHDPRRAADFLAASARLVVEVDGGSHVERAKADARRDRFLAGLGYRVLRLEDELVVEDLDAAVARVRAALSAG